MMFRTVWSEKLVLPAIGLAAQDATQPPLDACGGFWEAPADAAAGTAAAAPRTSAPPPRTAASHLPRKLADGKSFTFAPLAPSPKNFGIPPPKSRKLLSPIYRQRLRVNGGGGRPTPAAPPSSGQPRRLTNQPTGSRLNSKRLVPLDQSAPRQPAGKEQKYSFITIRAE